MKFGRYVIVPLLTPPFIGALSSSSCVFDACALINGLLLGTVSSVVASALTYVYLTRKQKRDLRSKYGRAEGEYVGHTYNHETQMPNEEIVSRARVTYHTDNVLSIRLEQFNAQNSKEENLVWIGEIIMQLEEFGTVAWHYTNWDDRHVFGFKRLILKENQERVFVYLVGEGQYAEEILIRSKTATPPSRVVS